MAKNFYETLGVARAATEKDIRSAYRKLARQHHPDVNPGDKAAEARFKEINAANDILSDADKRKKYDKYGDRWEQADQIEEAQKRQTPFSWARQGGPTGNVEGNSGQGDFGSVFDSILRRERGGPRGQPSARRGQDLEHPIEISLEEAFQGTTRTLSLQAPENCRVCGGSGEIAGNFCATCDGVGQTNRPRRLEVKVPAGVKIGSRVRVAGEGRLGSGGGPAGDLYLVVSVLPHARFERSGDNLAIEVNVPVTDAVLGGEVEVTTLTGRVALRIPELTQNGRQIRLAGKGMPTLVDPTKRGDLFVRVRVLTPERLSAEERALFEQLRSLASRPTVNA